MPYQFHIDPRLQTVFFEARGVMSTPEFLTCLQDVVTDPRFRPGFKHLVDLTRCTRMAPDAEAMRRRILIDRALEAKLGQAPCALVTGNFFVYASTRIYKILARNGPLTVELFQDLASARQWLGLPSGSESDQKSAQSEPVLPDTTPPA
jgi:hypothetical protein